MTTTFMITAPPPSPPVVAAPTLTGPVNGSVVRDTVRPVALGTGTIGSVITVRSGGAVVCTAVVGPDGRWSCTPLADLSAGVHTYTATQRANSPGALESGSVSTTFTIELPALPAPVILTPAEGGFAGRTPQITGTGKPGAQVSVTNVTDGAVLCTALVGFDGKWSCRSSQLPFGGQRIKAVQKMPDGPVSPVSPVRNFTVAVTLSGAVFKDSNRNGRLDAGELVMDGVRLELGSAGPDGTFGTSDDVQLGAATTRAGVFSFPGIMPGMYQLRLISSTLPRGMYPTNDKDGSADRRIVVDVPETASALQLTGPVLGADAATLGSLDFGEMFAGIDVVVRDAQGNPIRNADVSFTDAAGTVFTGRTDAQGRLVIDGSADKPMALGSGQVTATLSDGRSTTTDVGVATTVTKVVAQIPGDAPQPPAPTPPSPTSGPGGDQEATADQTLPYTGAIGVWDLLLPGLTAMVAGVLLLVASQHRHFRNTRRQV
ncbi:hypothetical protein KEM60_00131 [Austwickia sp. TVS 96-490-7B]|uniref:Ig-like domain-containing protein n=1 Tax=Austwickia sp. TVS 96-490-7B TaxID=2830843 RepID=UPI001C55B350|nr:Ig-like domain-containing protein [Austwickia sp. TVS 96-490-7B]MBW3083948.1 hypothetical protein [Austwickia sp. TVS 96-490-7B]